ncbi:MAG: glycosyltransferase [Desulfovibrionaceae bacterium]
MTPAPRQISAIFSETGQLSDIAIQYQGRNLHMLGPGGPAREQAIVENFINHPCGLPVLLGTGLGHALHLLLEGYAGPVAVVDADPDLLTLSRVKEALPAHMQQRVCWILCQNPHEALRQLTHWQMNLGILSPLPPLVPLIHPVYARVHPQFYGPLREKLQRSARTNFWQQAVQPRFTTQNPRLLLITSQYFLMGELIGACQALNIPFQLLTIDDNEIASSTFVEQLLSAAVHFKPDAVLTLNHLGVDREGVLMDVLEKLQLPLASWFVDNPHLILHLYHKLVSPWTTIFTWDVDNIFSLKAMGFEHVFYLPLATDPRRFSLTRGIKESSVPAAWRAQVSFVGNSMLYKVGARLKKGQLSRPLLTSFKRTAARFGETAERSIRAFLQHETPALQQAYAALPNNETRLTYETALTWEATRQYRTLCVAQLLPFTPLLVGDPGWHIVFRRQAKQVRLHPELAYYDQLPHFYPCSDINFNCTSKQMKGAVNQRIFDVPATGAFVLTDWREQMDELFEPHTEIAYYQEPEEIPERIRYFLAHPQQRQRIATAARKRILAAHTWQHRLQTLLQRLREVYGTPQAPTGERA